MLEAQGRKMLLYGKCRLTKTISGGACKQRYDNEKVSTSESIYEGYLRITELTG